MMLNFHKIITIIHFNYLILKLTLSNNLLNLLKFLGPNILWLINIDIKIFSTSTFIIFKWIHTTSTKIYTNTCLFFLIT